MKAEAYNHQNFHTKIVFGVVLFIYIYWIKYNNFLKDHKIVKLLLFNIFFDTQIAYDQKPELQVEDHRHFNIFFLK